MPRSRSRHISFVCHRPFVTEPSLLLIRFQALVAAHMTASVLDSLPERLGDLEEVSNDGMSMGQCYLRTAAVRCTLRLTFTCVRQSRNPTFSKPFLSIAGRMSAPDGCHRKFYVGWVTRAILCLT